MSLLKTTKAKFAVHMACGLMAFFTQSCALDLTDDSAIPPGEVGQGPTGAFGQPVEVFNNLIIEPFRTETYFSNQPVRGRGPSNGSLLVTHNNKTTSHYIPNGGSFCVDVPGLNPETNNQISFQALDIYGQPVLEEPIIRQVMQTGSPPPSDAPGDLTPSLVNVGPTAHNIDGEMTFTRQGFNSATTGWEPIFNDPSETTYVENHQWGKNFFLFDIDVETPVFEIAIQGDGITPLESVKVYYSNLEGDGEPFSDYITAGVQSENPEWNIWGQIPINNIRNTNVMRAPSGFTGTEIRRVAIHFDTETILEFLGEDIFGLGKHAINYITVNAIDPNAVNDNNNPSNIPGNTCAGGGR